MTSQPDLPPLDHIECKACGAYYRCRSCGQYEPELHWVDPAQSSNERKDFAQSSAWISVEERLPAYGERGIVTFRGRIDRLLYVCYDTLIWTGAQWKVPGSGCFYTGQVTHWQPLPAPPDKGSVSAIWATAESLKADRV